MKPSASHARLSLLIAALALGLLIPALVRPTLAAQQFASAGGLTFNGTGAAGPANPYPSTIAVSGLKGSITKLTVQLSGVTHSFPDALDILLVGPDGKQALLMSDAGGGTAISGLALTFADSAASALPNGSGITSGSFRPTNYEAIDDFPAPGPGDPDGNTALSIFNLTNPNGEWKLFAVEDGTGSTGSIGGWALTFETAELSAAVAADPATVDAGDRLTYEFTVKNDGTEAVTGPTITVALPAGTTFSWVDDPDGWSCEAPVGGAFTCTTPSFGAGTSATFKVSLLVDQALLPGDTITRTVSISSSVAEANTADNSASATTTITTLADLRVASVDTPDDVQAGAEMPIVVEVLNEGLSNAAAAVVTIPIPASTTFVSITAPEGWNCTAPAVGASGQVVCTRAIFAAGAAPATFTVVVKTDPALPPTESPPNNRFVFAPDGPAPGSMISASATVAAATPDSDGSNNSAGDSTAIVTATDLTVELSASPDPVSSAAELTITMVVTNNGPSNAANTVLSTEVPSGLTFESLAAPDGWNCSSIAVGDIGTIDCVNSSLAVTNQTFTLKVRVLSGTPVETVLSVSADVETDTQESVTTNNSATTTATVTIASDLAMSIDGVGTAVGSGSTLTYNLRVNNSGPELAEGVTLTTATPPNSTFLSLSKPARWSCTTPAVGGSGAITCTNTGLRVATDVLALTVQLGNVPNGTAVPMTAMVATSADTDKNPANNSATLNSVVAIAADVSVTVNGPATPARPNAELTYSLQVSNSGPERAPDARLALTIPANSTFVALAAPDGWSCAAPAVGDTGVVSCTHPSLGIGTAGFTLTLKVNNVTENTAVNLAVAVSSASQDPTPANNDGALNTSVIARYRSFLPIVTR